jgi:hypothetical protein
LCLIQRSAGTIQIGVDPPRRILVRDAPLGTFDLLAALNGEHTITELTSRFGDRHNIPSTSWDQLLADLVDAGFLINADHRSGDRNRHEWTGSQPDRASLTIASGATHAVAAMTNRQDAIAVVIGSGRVAGSVGTLLAAAGVGHVYVDPHRALRPTDVAPAGFAHGEMTLLNTARATEAVAHGAVTRPRRPPRRPNKPTEQPRRADREALAAMIRRISPEVNVHPPGGYLPPTIVILATDGPPDQVQARGLVNDRVPHLAVRASELRGIIGPFVLPARSSCLHCHDLHRRDADPGWPRVLLAMQRALPVPPAVLATSVAAATAGQVLQFLDGNRMPDSVDGTLELGLSDWVVRRRSWQPHPACFCQSGQFDRPG